MRSNPRIHCVLQLLIVVSCLIDLSSRLSEYTKAQTCSPSLPLQSPSFPGLEMGWPQGTNVVPRIYDRVNGTPTSEAEFGAINTAVMDWNNISVAGCSNVTIGNSVRVGRAFGETEEIPNDSVAIYWVRDRNGQFYQVWAGNHMRAGQILMNSSLSMDATDPRLRTGNLPKHEMGHSFGVGDGSLTSVMEVLHGRPR
jgi:hypothetical protein